MFALTNTVAMFILLDMSSKYRTSDRKTTRAIALVCLADALVGTSFGAIAVAGGLPPWVPVALSVLVFAGGAQFAAVAVVLTGGGQLAALATGLVLNARHLPFGFAVADAIEGRWRTKLVGAHLMIDESVAFTLAESDPRQRRRVYWTTGIGLFVCWNLAVLLGALAGGAVGSPEALGLDAAFPTVLLALVLPALTDRRIRNAAVAGAVLAVAATPFLPAGVPVLLALAALVLVGRETTPVASRAAA